MKINRVRYLKGPNYFSYKPAIWVELDLEELEFQPSNALAGFNQALLQSIPTLAEHTCSLGYQGGFLKRLNEGTWMGHILEHIALELQWLAGINATRGKTISSRTKGIYYVTYEYKEEKSGFYAFEAAVNIVEQLMASEKAVQIKPFVKKIEALYYQFKLGPSTEAIYHAAYSQKIPVERIGNDSILRLGIGSKQKWVQATTTSQTSSLAVDLSCDKHMTKEILSQSGVPVPIGEMVTTISEIYAAAERLGYPLVLKPLDSCQGNGVVTNIKNRGELFNVIHQRGTIAEKLIIEKYIDGNDYRLLVVDGKFVAASYRIPPFVVGNGKDTIRTLILQENENPLRGDGHEKPMSKIRITENVVRFLEKTNLTLESIPEKGKVIQIAGNANLSTGGQAIDVTDLVHPSIKTMAITAAKAIGLDIAGVDFLCKDISAPLDRNHSAVVEVNAAPGIRMHQFPSKGKKRDAGKAIIDYLFKNWKEAAIPVVAITGTNGKTTTTRLVAHFLEEDGITIGMTNSDGVYIGGEAIDEGDCSGPISARKILANPTVDIAVLETARGGILREGLAFRFCDVGIVTNVTEDHLGLDGIETFDQLVKLKRLIPEVVADDGYCILNADDPEVAKMAAYTNGEVIYTSTSGNHPLIQQAAKDGKTAWYLADDGWISCLDKGVEKKFLPAKEIPITIEGTARHNIANLLQALAAAHSQGRSIEILKEKALCFLPTVEQSKGRFNRFQLDGREIIVDYAHNIAGLTAIYETIHQLKPMRVISALTCPGDRQNKEIREMARIAARNSHQVILREDADLRGRAPSEVANLMAESILQDPSSTKQISIVLDELEAYLHAWQQSQKGDLLILLYEKFSVASHFLEIFFAEKHVNKQII